MKRDEPSRNSPTAGHRRPGNRVAGAAKNFAREFVGPGPRGIHPALIPGVGVEQTGRVYRTDWLVFGVAAAFTIAFIAWGILSGDHMSGATQSVQNSTIIAALPFAFILVLMMVSLMKDLRTDPLILRGLYAQKALRHGVRTGLEEYGDDFALLPSEYDHSRDGHPWVDVTHDEALTETFETASMPIIKPDDEAHDAEERT